MSVDQVSLWTLWVTLIGVIFQILGYLIPDGKGTSKINSNINRYLRLIGLNLIIVAPLFYALFRLSITISTSFFNTIPDLAILTGLFAMFFGLILGVVWASVFFPLFKKMVLRPVRRKTNRKEGDKNETS